MIKKINFQMIIEVTTLKIQPGKNNEFEAAIKKSAESFIAPFPGCQGYSLRHCIEEPLQYVIEIQWKTLADHIEGFRASEAFTEWRANISLYFAESPNTYNCEFLATKSI